MNNFFLILVLSISFSLPVNADFYMSSTERFIHDKLVLSISNGYHQAFSYTCKKEPSMDGFLMFFDTVTYKKLRARRLNDKPIGIFSIIRILKENNELENFCKE